MDTTQYLQAALGRLAQGEFAARDELFVRTQQRLGQLLSRTLHRDFARLRSVEQTDDLLQDLNIRLLKSWDRLLQDEHGQVIQEPAQFFSRVSRLIREVLLDAVRHHYGRYSARPQHQPLLGDSSTSEAPTHDPGSDTQNPEVLAQLTEFHRAVETLPEALRQVVDLHWYQQLPHNEVAAMLSLGESTVRKYWVKARLILVEQLGENPFSE